MLLKRYKKSTAIDSVIDIEKLNSGRPKCIERDASQLFSLTYPTQEFHSMFRMLSRRFDLDQDQKESLGGLVLAEGVKGQGKSHALLVAYHLFVNQEIAKPWLAELGYSWNPPNDTLVLVEKFTDQHLPLNSLWLHIADKLQISWDQDRPPSLTEFRSALAGRHVVLIFDELERGITNIPDPNRRSQNLSFLQMISEEANRNPQVTLVAAIYDGAVDPGATLKRIPRTELRFRNSEDRAAIVRHRLFSNAESYDRRAAEDLIQSYVNTWKKLGAHITEEYVARLRGTFPILPDLIDPRLNRKQLDKSLNGKRYREFDLHEHLPVPTNGLWVDSARRLAVLTGRIHNRPQAPSPSQSLYRHGGLSLMEMLTPWLILGPKGSLLKMSGQ